MNTDNIIEFENVSKAYSKEKLALRSVNLSVPEGSCYGLLGRNGAGKSTAMRLIMGMLTAGEGSVRVFGEDPREKPVEVKSKIGYMAEDHEFPDFLTPRDLFRLYASLYPKWDNGFVKELVKKLKLPIGRALKSMSKGQKRQVGLICAVAHKPPLLVLDEPGGGLDPVVRREFLDTVIELLVDEGTTVIYSSHILQEVERISDHVAILGEGELILNGEITDLRENVCQALVEGIVSADTASIPDCVKVTKREDATVLTLLCGQEEARARIQSALGKEPRQLTQLSLEDLFINLTSR